MLSSTYPLNPRSRLPIAAIPARGAAPLEPQVREEPRADDPRGEFGGGLLPLEVDRGLLRPGARRILGDLPQRLAPRFPVAGSVQSPYQATRPSVSARASAQAMRGNAPGIGGPRGVRPKGP
jgi:hypothetical protein